MRYRFWVKSGLQLLGCVILASGIFTLMMALQNHGHLLLRELCQQAAIFLLTSGALFQILYYLAAYKLSMPLVLSFGSTRKEILWGFQIQKLVLSLGCVVLCLLLSLYAPRRLHPALVLGFFLLASALGSLLGILSQRFGKIVGIISAILFGVGCAFIGGFAGAGMLRQTTLFFSAPISWGILILGIAVFALMILPEKKTIDKMIVNL